jgi:formate hydrogenlyase subunit 6/NADH:ubiquinone oxidoreductase subunit I
MKYPKIRELKEAVVSLLTPAYTTRFPHRPHIPFENFRGKPVVDDANCVGCETCANVCPSNAITFKDDRGTGKRIITRDFGKCIFCGMCQQHCITGKGVALSDKIFDLAVFERDKVVETQEKELLICKNCKAIITTKEHIHFMHQKLGTKAFSSILNLSLLNEKLKLAPEEKTDLDVKDSLKRKDMFNIICPNCMRTILIQYI